MLRNQNQTQQPQSLTRKFAICVLDLASSLSASSGQADDCKSLHAETNGAALARLRDRRSSVHICDKRKPLTCHSAVGDSSERHSLGSCCRSYEETGYQVHDGVGSKLHSHPGMTPEPPNAENSLQNSRPAEVAMGKAQ